MHGNTTQKIAPEHSSELTADKPEKPYWTISYKYSKSELQKAIEGIFLPPKKNLNP
jgi:hypothetical protein